MSTPGNSEIDLDERNPDAADADAPQAAPADGPRDGAGRTAPGKLALGDEQPLARAFAAAFAAIVDYALAMVAVGETDPVRAVHEYRKSLRRARAMVRLVRDSIGGAEAKALTNALRSAQRATSELRDRDVLSHALTGLEQRPRWQPLAEHLRRELASRDVADAYVRGVLEAGAEVLRPLPARFAAAVPEDLSWDAVTAGLEASYRRARRRLRAAKAARTAETLHEWRKRNKEITYQLELLQGRAPEVLGPTRDEFAALSQRLGDITDLVLLAQHLSEAGGASGSDTGLDERVRRRIRKRSKKAFRVGAELYARSPKKFARKTVERVAASEA